MRNFIDSLKARRDAAKNEGGFSLIDVVVTVAIIVALSVGGFVTYSGIVDNAKSAATASAADQVYTALTVQNSGAADPDMADPIIAYNESAKGEITVVEGEGVNIGKVAAFHKASKLDADTTYLEAVAADADPLVTKFVSVRG